MRLEILCGNRKASRKVRSSEGQYRYRGRLLEARWSFPRFLYLFVYMSYSSDVFYYEQFADVACFLGWGNVVIFIVWSVVRSALERQACAEVISCLEVADLL